VERQGLPELPSENAHDLVAGEFHHTADGSLLAVGLAAERLRVSVHQIRVDRVEILLGEPVASEVYGLERVDVAVRGAEDALVVAESLPHRCSAREQRGGCGL